MGRGCEQLIGAGSYSWVVLLAALLGLVVLWRQSRPAALALTLTALTTIVMIFAGRSVHHMIAVRYFTVLQPAVWMGLATLVVCAGILGPCRIGRRTCGAVGGASLAVDPRRSLGGREHLALRPGGDAVYRRCADSDDRVVCTPEVNFGWVARYYDLLGPDDERRQQLVKRTADADDGATWVMAYMFDPRSERTIRKLVEDARAGERSAAERERIVAAVRDKGLAVVRLSADRCDTWVYDARRDDFAPLETIIADRPTGVRTAAAVDDSVR